MALTNTGGEPLVISAMAIVGPGAFGIEGGCGTIAPESSCTVTLTFLPTGIATFAGRLDIASNHSGGTVQVQLSGQGVELPRPDLDFSSTVLSFTNNWIFPSNFETITVRLTNIGVAPVTIGALRATLPDYLIPPGRCVGVLAPLASCDIPVSFVPLAPGPRLGTLFVDSTPPQDDSVALIGTGCRRLVPGSRIPLSQLCR